MSLRCEIIAVGTELLALPRNETNSVFLGQRLASLGIVPMRKFVVGDRRLEIAQALEAALAADSDVICLTGGLGPTADDLTREAVADALGLELRPDQGLLRRLERLYSRFSVPMSDNNRRQALVPEGAQVLNNSNGTAPGLFLEKDRSLIFLLPGPPRELKPLFESQVLEIVSQRKPVRPRRERRLKVCGMTESAVDAAAEPIYSAYPGIETTVLASAGIIDLIFVWQGGDDADSAEAGLEEVASKVSGALGKAVYANRNITLEEAVGEQLSRLDRTLATAESCTGGWMAKLLTDVPGSSHYFRGGAVSYSNDLKTLQLGVSEITLERFGAVSPQVAEQMAQGVRQRSGADYGLSATGVAGPGGGSDDKPVGLVYLGLATPSGAESKRLQLPGDREAIRLRSARYALDWLRRTLA